MGAQRGDDARPEPLGVPRQSTAAMGATTGHLDRARGRAPLRRIRVARLARDRRGRRGRTGVHTRRPHHVPSGRRPLARRHSSRPHVQRRRPTRRHRRRLTAPTNKEVNHDRNHPDRRAGPAVQQSRRAADPVGDRSRRARRRRDLLDLDRSARRPASRHAAHGGAARRRPVLLHRPDRTEGAQPRDQPEGGDDDGCELDERRARPRPRGRCRPSHRHPDAGRGGRAIQVEVRLDVHGPRRLAAQRRRWRGVPVPRRRATRASASARARSTSARPATASADEAFPQARFSVPRR